MTEPIHIFATIRPKPEHFEAARNAIARIVPMTLEEKGCQVFSLFEALSEPGTLHLFEIFDNEVALADHYAQDYTANVFDAYEDWLAEPVHIQKLKPFEKRAEGGGQ
jgi:quinol monooxygenase YgiN